MKVLVPALSTSLLLLAFIHPATSFKAGDFKTCSQSGFCRRGRALAERARENVDNWHSPYSVDPLSLSLVSERASLTARVKSELYPDIKFSLEVHVHEDGVIRVRMDEVDGLRKRYDEAAKWALAAEPSISTDIQWKVDASRARAAFGQQREHEVVVDFKPLRVVLNKNGKEQVVINGRGLLHMEHFRNKTVEEPQVETEEEGSDTQEVLKVNPNAWFEGNSEDAFWEESFGSWTDTKPKGPESLSLDIDFPRHGHVYGIPQHATSLDLPTTTGENPFFEEPYRFYNADVFEYLASATTSLYGSIPLMHAHSADSTVAIFNVVGSEAWIDIAHPNTHSTSTHWISESGILDLFILSGPTPTDVFRQYGGLTGTAPLPAHWALGYHQCRWNYVSSDDVRGVQKRFDEEDMPVDVFWLDIEYSTDHQYMIWDKKNFPDPVEMTNDVAALGRKMVVIVDPHLKRVDDYPVYKQARDLGILVKQKNGQDDYEGWCWPGSSAWVDFFNPASWEFWKSLFKTTKGSSWSWIESTEDIHIWNDMNEPSVFNGPEITMPKDLVHYGGWEHRDIHNINGMFLPKVTSEGLIARGATPKRPFVLTRSFFAGSQRYSAMWTGDNLGTWEHMTVGIKMVLSNGIAGMTFAGSDVGGFFGNPESEMLVRWYWVGAFSPFFRAHAHLDSKRREPYLLDEPHRSTVRNILRLRYSLLPVWYTAFHETSVTGLPILRPHYVIFPQDEAGFSIDDQFYLGSSGLLVKPVTRPGVTEEIVYIPEDKVYYDYFTYQTYRGSPKGKHVTVPAELHQLPLLVRGGSIVPTRDRPRRASSLMHRDPFTLRVALDESLTAHGELYLDDGVTYAHKEGHLAWRGFSVNNAGAQLRLSNVDLAAATPRSAVEGGAIATFDRQNAFQRGIESVRVERVVVLGLPDRPKRVVVEGGHDLEWEYAPGVAAGAKKDGVASVLTIKNPRLGVASDWAIQITL
ncbi:glycoside hydrolase family 31 protein [Lactarius akahatsu]|uniref:Glucosidase II subunit alpha n=1 Tax=Lactarius akahatsu TaxID=416441 RepID=A0AAD4LQX2_9AGAM|nr:glycoside hydrolase family 31 protein [Lactarius akahatsu]